MKVSIIGCGNMGMAYARSFVKYNLVAPGNLFLIEKSETRRSALQDMNIGTVALLSNGGAGESDVIILSVKPQDFSAAAEDLRPVLRQGQVILSIMAGVRMERIARELNHRQIVRAMPNSPAELGLGMTGFTASEGLDMQLLRQVENLLNSTGRSVYFENEDMIDTVTAISGSGPAYFFFFVQQMIAAAQSMGMEEATANILVKQTMIGAYHLINQSGKPLTELIKAVASKGGTTEAALSVMEVGQVGPVIISALRAAEERARELSKG